MPTHIDLLEESYSSAGDSKDDSKQYLEHEGIPCYQEKDEGLQQEDTADDEEEEEEEDWDTKTVKNVGNRGTVVAHIAFVSYLFCR